MQDQILGFSHLFLHVVRLAAVLWLACPGLKAENPAELFQAGRFQEAANELTDRVEALEALPNPSPDDQRELANTLLALGMSYQSMGQEKGAIAHLERALELTKSLDIKTTDRAQFFDTLARAQQQAGLLDEAEANFRQSLNWSEKEQTPEAADWQGLTRDHLGLLLLTRGNYQEAGKLIQRSLAQTTPEQPRLLAQRHHYLARYLHSIRNYHRAIKHAETSLEIGRNYSDLDLASFLDLLALSRYRAGDPEGAETALLEALELLRQQPITLQRARGEAEILNKVGQFALEEEVTLAQSSFQEALDGLLEWLPEDHPSLAVYYNNLGLAAMRMGDHHEAKKKFTRAIAILEDQIDGLQLGHQRLAEWKQNLAWNALLNGDEVALKGLVAEACTEAEAVLLHLLENGSEQERLNFLTHFDLYSLPAAAGEAKLLQGLLQRNKGKLLDSLISRERADRAGASLPAGSAFIDFVRYRRPKGMPKGRAWAMAYGAILERPNAPVQFIPLSEEKILLRWLKVVAERLDYRSLVIGGQQPEPPVLRLEGALHQLHQHFLTPLLDQIPDDTQTLILSPDGALHFAPFAVFLDAERQFFAHRKQVVYNVSSRRDIFENSSQSDRDDLAERANLATGPWMLFGMSQFGASASLGKDNSPILETFPDLPHVEHELGELLKIAPANSQKVLNPERPESALKNLSDKPTVLHLATHAFFRGREEGNVLFDLDAQPDILLQSGLALSGPNGNEDGILYPHEIAHLPLEETELVSLSACDTALGTPVAGEGVLGLRRAFALAGAKRLLLTLWQVPDNSTADFMADFYQEALRTNNPSQALWQLQGRLLDKEAGFSEDDAALEEAVLRYGPFLITHRGPIPEAIISSSPPIKKQSVFWWRYLLWIVVFGGLIAVLLRISSRQKRRSTVVGTD